MVEPPKKKPFERFQENIHQTFETARQQIKSIDGKQRAYLEEARKWLIISQARGVSQHDSEQAVLNALEFIDELLKGN